MSQDTIKFYSMEFDPNASEIGLDVFEQTQASEEQQIVWEIELPANDGLRSISVTFKELTDPLPHPNRKKGKEVAAGFIVLGTNDVFLTPEDNLFELFYLFADKSWIHTRQKDSSKPEIINKHITE